MSQKEKFEKIMRENGPKIYTLAVRITGNISDGQDLAQETFMKAYKNFDRFRGDSHIGTWLYRICINLWKNRVKYEKRRHFWQHFSINSRDPDDASTPQELTAHEPSVDHPLEIKERQNLIQEALEKLESEERAILILRDMEDTPYEEISEILDIPLGTVKSRLARSRERLRHILENYIVEK